MLDLASIVFTTALCVFVAFRALDLDRRLPWFGRQPTEGGPPASEAAGRRRG